MTERRNVLGQNRYAVIGIRLAPGAFRGPVVAFVDRVNDSEVVLVLNGAFQQLANVVVLLITDARSVEPGRRDDPLQRSPRGASGGIHDVPDGPGRVGMQFIDDRAV